MTWFLVAVRQEVKRTDNSVVVHVLELAIKRDLYGRLWSLGNQYNEEACYGPNPKQRPTKRLFFFIFDITPTIGQP